MEYDGSARDMTEAECRKQERARQLANINQYPTAGESYPDGPLKGESRGISPVSEPHYRLSRRIAQLQERGGDQVRLATKLQALLDCLPNRMPIDAQEALHLLINNLGAL